MTLFLKLKQKFTLQPLSGPGPGWSGPSVWQTQRQCKSSGGLHQVAFKEAKWVTASQWREGQDRIRAEGQ